MITKLAILEGNPKARILVTPVGHDFMRLSGVVNIPWPNVVGFMDRSQERLTHNFMGHQVCLRSPESVRALEATTILVCSTAYQDEIVEEITTWGQDDVDVIPFYQAL